MNCAKYKTSNVNNGGRYCEECNSDKFKNRGKTPDGRQRIQCLSCHKSYTIGVRRMGEELYSESKMLPLLLKNPEDFSKEEFWSMGLLIADGSLSKTNQMSITLKQEDTNTLELLREALRIPNEVKPTFSYIKDKETQQKIKVTYSRLTWGYKFATEKWQEIGLIQGKTSNEVWLPYMENSHFVRGFFDGDGGFSLSSNRATFSGASFSFLESLQKYLNTILKNEGSLNFSNGAWNLSYSGQYALGLGSFMYQNSEEWRMKRKFDTFLQIKERVEASLENGVHVARITHGETLGGSPSKEYRVWQKIKQRCLNPKDEYYHLYGGKGIVICDRWLDSFSNFLEDVGRAPNMTSQFKRKDNFKSYSIENCYWS